MGDKLNTWTDNRLLAVGRVLGLKVTRQTRVVRSPYRYFYRTYIISPEPVLWPPTEIPEMVEAEVEDIELNCIAGFNGIEEMGYGPKSDTLVVKLVG